MLAATLAAIPCPIEAKMTWARELRSQECSWGEIDRITGVKHQAYTRWARRRVAWASEDA